MTGRLSLKRYLFQSVLVVNLKHLFCAIKRRQKCQSILRGLGAGVIQLHGFAARLVVDTLLRLEDGVHEALFKHLFASL